MNIPKKIFLVTALLILLSAITGCSKNSGGSNDDKKSDPAPSEPILPNPVPEAISFGEMKFGEGKFQ